jgi:hypothetical protein
MNCIECDEKSLHTNCACLAERRNKFGPEKFTGEHVLETHPENCHFVPLSPWSGQLEWGQGALNKSFQDEKIGRHDDSRWPFNDRVARGTPKLPLFFCLTYTISS